MKIAKNDSNEHRHWWLYVLRLADGKWYVGITSKTPEIRFQEHLEGTKAAYWTAKHKPIEIVYREDLGDTTKAKAERRENKYTRELMKQRGINNVRGGDLTDTADYIVRFGTIYDKESWEDLVYITLMFIALILLLADKYVVAFIPGGIR